MKTQRVILNRFSTSADEAVVTAESDLKPLADGRIRIRLAAAPVNPADLNIIEGKYGALPGLPAPIGNEASGFVIESRYGPIPEGTLVAAPGPGAWASVRDVPGDEAIPLADGTDPVQASMLTVNPPTALAMLADFVNLGSGDWIVQNAANSGVGRAVIAIAARRGIHTLNVVRREALIPGLLSCGADRVVMPDFDFRNECKRLCGGARPRLALNAVGGQSALDLANALGDGGVHVTFGAMSKQPLKIPNGLLIFRDIQFRGFWLRRWFGETPEADRIRALRQIAEWAREGCFKIPVAGTFPLERIHDALAAASNSDRDGKILLAA